MIIKGKEKGLKTALKSFGIIGLRLYFCTPKKRRDDLVAQLVEQYTFNVWALGSSPSGITKVKPVYQAFFMPFSCILYSEKLNKYYIGACTDPKGKLYEHNIGHLKFR